MNPYETPTRVAGFVVETPIRRPLHRIAVASIGATSALVTWTGAVIYHIDTKYKPIMGFLAMILVGLALGSSIPLCVIVFRFSTLTSHRVMVVPFLILILLLIAILSLSVPLLEWARSLELSLMQTYTSLLALILVPPLLTGFVVSVVAAWLDSILSQNGGEPADARESPS